MANQLLNVIALYDKGTERLCTQPFLYCEARILAAGSGQSWLTSDYSSALNDAHYSHPESLWTPLSESNKYEWKQVVRMDHLQELTDAAAYASGGRCVWAQQMADGSTVLREMTPWTPSWNYNNSIRTVSKWTIDRVRMWSLHSPNPIRSTSICCATFADLLYKKLTEQITAQATFTLLYDLWPWQWPVNLLIIN